MELVDDITEKLTNEFLVPNVEQVRPRVKKKIFEHKVIRLV